MNGGRGIPSSFKPFLCFCIKTLFRFKKVVVEKVDSKIGRIIDL